MNQTMGGRKVNNGSVDSVAGWYHAMYNETWRLGYSVLDTGSAHRTVLLV